MSDFNDDNNFTSQVFISAALTNAPSKKARHPTVGFSPSDTLVLAT